MAQVFAAPPAKRLPHPCVSARVGPGDFNDATASTLRNTIRPVRFGVRRSHLSQRTRKMGHPAVVAVSAECMDPFGELAARLFSSVNEDSGQESAHPDSKVVR